MDNSRTPASFPSELISSKEKEKKEYGLQLAKAIYYSSNSSGNSLFYNEKEIYRTYIKYANGNQDIAQYKPLLGINTNNIKESMLPSIDWGIKNYATKRVNVAVSKMVNREYDPIVSAIDQLANDFKKDYKSRVKSFVENKSWLQEKAKQLGTDFTPPGIDLTTLPDNDEEIELHALSNTKLRSEIELEHGIAYHLQKNNYEYLRKELDYDLFVLGVCAVWVGMDENHNPTIKRIRPEDAIMPYSENPNYNNINYGGDIRRLTVGELKRLANDQFSSDEYDIIAEQYTTDSDRGGFSNDITQNHYGSDNRDVRKVRVLHFEWTTQDELVHVSKKDNAGNERFSQKNYDYYKSTKEQEKFKAKYPDRELVRTPYKSTYCGYWIVGSNYIFSYGQKKSQTRERGNLGETSLGYKFFAPNIYDGEVVSTIKQMIPVLNNLQAYNLKIQHTVARAIPKGVEIDLHQLSKVKFKGSSGKDMTPSQLLSMYFQTGILVRDSSGKYAPGSTDKPISELSNGMSNDVVHYMNLIKHSLEELDEITGVNRVVSGSNLHQDTGKSVAQMQMNGAETALDYLYKADEYVFLEVCKTLGILHVESIKYGGKDKYKNIIGEASSKFLLQDSGILEHDFGFFLEKRPSPEEWQRLYATVDIAVQQGQIGIDDSAKITDIKNLKEAKLHLQYSVNKLRKIQQQAKEQDSQLNGQVQQQSNEQAHANAMAQEEAKRQTIILQAEQERETIRLKIQLETEKELAIASMKGSYKLNETDMITNSGEQRELVKAISQDERSKNKPLNK